MALEVKRSFDDGWLGSSPQGFPELLEGFYRDLLDLGIPPELARLVKRLEEATGAAAKSGTRALVVEPDEGRRDAAILVLRETGLEATGCTRAREALDHLRMHGNDTVFAFCDETLAGERDGISLVEMITILWPGIHVVLTSEASVEPPPGVVRLVKPWRALDLLAQVHQALRPSALRL